jgi:tetratricopeptide (TPR) repeat protein
MTIAQTISGDLASLLSNYDLSLQQLQKKHSSDQHVFELLVQREQVARHLAQNGPSNASLMDSLCQKDADLKAKAPLVIPALRRHGSKWRNTIQPAECSWWWYLDKDEKANPIWAILTTLFFGITISLFTDFSRKLFSVEPDSYGLLTIALQASLTVAAGSAFTESGKEWFGSLLHRLKVPGHFHAMAKSLVAFVLAGLVMIIWLVLPGRLATYYNDKAVNLTPSLNPSQVLAGVHKDGERIDLAKKYFQRAINLNPDIPEAHFNLGVLYEQSMQYDQAIQEYQAATNGESTQGRSTALKAYNNLARLLILHRGDYRSALRLLDVVIQQGLAPNDVAYSAIYRNRGWADFELGFFHDAESDFQTSLKQQRTGAADCLLALTYQKDSKPNDAKIAWQNFQKDYAPQDPQQPPIEPDCSRSMEVQK